MIRWNIELVIWRNWTRDTEKVDTGLSTGKNNSQYGGMIRDTDEDDTVLLKIDPVFSL